MSEAAPAEQSVRTQSTQSDDTGNLVAASAPASSASDSLQLHGALNGVLQHNGRHTSGSPSIAPPAISRGTWAGLTLIFSSTILISAFLLFQVQPLISKYILPWFGGSPQVWTTCMLFFQLVLFAGYLYAHLLTRYLSNRWQAIVHLSLIAITLAVILPTVAPAVSWKPIDSTHPTGRILLLLGATVGLPYFVLSTTGPLVQAWFARTWPSRSPYRLYALSNLGSLAALVTYPFVVEPAFASDTQAGIWTMAFGLFAVLCGLSALWILRMAASQTQTASSAGAASAVHTHPTLVRRVLWVALPACASLMLLATTNYVCQDVAVIPFLWVVPLALYLLTFIISFDHPRWYQPLPMSVLAIVLLMMSAGMGYFLFKWFNVHMNFKHELALYFSTMFFACLVCHGQVVRLRPAADHLTEFYLLISAGGAIGGIFVGLIAPQIFVTHFEWPLGLAFSTAVAATVAVSSIARRARNRRSAALKFGGVGLVGALVAGCAYWLVVGLTDDSDIIYRGRNFYGTVSVYEVERNDPEYHRRTFFSGTTAHGKQLLSPEKQRMPISYFGEQTGVGRTMKYFQNRSDARVGIVGMGVAVAAAYARPGQYFRFYEINDQVDNIARNYFSYLKNCEGKCDVVMADARLALERELAAGQPQHFDVLALDAFMSDAPPVHLLTDEAFAIYLQHLKPDGVIVVNITNRYINLAPVIEAVAKKHGLGVTRIETDDESKKLLNHTDFMMLTRNKDFLAANPPVLLEKYRQPDFEVPLWTDKYSNLFSILKQ